MKYTYEYIIRYQDVDDTKHMRWVALEEYLLNMAGRVADELGFGIAVLHPRDLTWIITHLSAQMTYMPMPQQHVVFETWIEQNAHMLSTRDFRIYLKPYPGSSRKKWLLIGAYLGVLGLLAATLMWGRTVLGAKRWLYIAGFGMQPLERLWRRAAAAQELAEGEREALAALGAVLGRCGAERQCAEIGLVRRRLSDAAAALERELALRGRRYDGLGAALGAIVAAVLF